MMEPHAPPDPQPQPEEPSTSEVHGGIRGLIRDIRNLDRRVVVVLVTVPIVLTLLDYYGLPWHYRLYVEADQSMLVGERRVFTARRPAPPLVEHLEGLDLPGPRQLRHFVWWGIACLLFLVAIPTIAAAAVRVSPRELGVRLKGTGRDAWTYLLLFLVFFPVVYLVSRQPAFQHTYPFYKPRPGQPLGADFLVFEVIYCLQFFAIEYFFRGFIVLGLKPRLGMASVLVMLAPYWMIHYYKPMPEALGAIGAGVVLGLLAYRTRTVIYGWFLHYAVALSMDYLALSQAGRL